MSDKVPMKRLVIAKPKYSLFELITAPIVAVLSDILNVISAITWNWDHIFD